MNIEAAIRKTVEQQRLSVNQLAKDTGLNQSGLNRFFNGSKSELQLSTIQILFDYLDLEVRQKRRTGHGSKA